MTHFPNDSNEVLSNNMNSKDNSEDNDIIFVTRDNNNHHDNVHRSRVHRHYDEIFNSQITETEEGSCGSREESTRAMSDKELVECAVMESNEINNKSNDHNEVSMSHKK